MIQNIEGMTYVERDDIPEEEVQAVYDQMTKAFQGQDVGTCMAAMCHKLATICAYFTRTPEEEEELLGLFQSDVIKRVPLYRAQLMGEAKGSA